MAVRPKGTPRGAASTEKIELKKPDFIFDIDVGIQDLLKTKGAGTVDELQDVVASCCLQACDCCLQVS
ncbi:MAG: hypothetical protein ACR2OR_06615 [Hyphomicrobiales bacterium]